MIKVSVSTAFKNEKIVYRGPKNSKYKRLDHVQHLYSQYKYDMMRTQNRQTDIYLYGYFIYVL